MALNALPSLTSLGRRRGIAVAAAFVPSSSSFLTSSRVLTPTFPHSSTRTNAECSSSTRCYHSILRGGSPRKNTIKSLALTTLLTTAVLSSQQHDDRHLSTLCAERDSEQENLIAEDNSTINGVKPNGDGVYFPEDALKYDTYNGVTLHASKLPFECTKDSKLFEIMLQQSLNKWTKDGRRGIWLHLNTEHSAMVPLCVELGFDFQYAKEGLLVLTKWLPTNQENRLPNGPTHQVGIGAMILHPTTGKMLVLQEKTGPAAARKIWKVPTGLSDPGEDISVAAVREVKEETGLDVIFDRIVCFRQSHGGSTFVQSDLYFICLMKLDPEKYKVGEEIVLRPQEEEILMIDWKDIDTYHDQFWKDSPLFTEMHNAMVKAAKESIEDGKTRDTDEQKSIAGFISKTLPMGFRPGSATVYTSRL